MPKTAPSPRASVVSVAALALLSGLASSCGTRDNPTTCSAKNPECGDMVCDLVKRLCVARTEDAGAADVAADRAPDMPPAPDASVDTVADVMRDTAPDGPGTCGRDGDCSGGRPFCVGGACVACKASDDCPSATPICTVAGACAACGDAAVTDPNACQKRAGGKHPVCDASKGTCVECAVHTDCASPTRPLCEGNACVACNAATKARCEDRDPGGPACAASSGRCVECVAHGDCKDPARPVCDTAANRCVSCAMQPAGSCAAKDARLPACEASSGRCLECVSSAECLQPARPICVANACVGCTSDAQCAAKLGANPGVCLGHQDGRCATDDDTVYVQKSGACASAGAPDGGTAAKPFCLPQDGIDKALAASKALVVMRGPTSLAFWSVSGAQSPLTVVGQDNAVIEPGAFVGIELVGSDVYVRGLRVLGGADTGVVARSGAILRMNRCVVEGNKGGGIKVDGAGFEITNTIVVDNSANALVGGVTLGAVPVGQPRRFANNTVVGNDNGAGVICSGANHTIQGSIVHGNVGPQVSGCTDTACCTGDPMLSSSHRLQAGSPCIDKLEPAASVPDDIDGDARPQGVRSDCGADELR